MSRKKKKKTDWSKISLIVGILMSIMGCIALITNTLNSSTKNSLEKNQIKMNLKHFEPKFEVLYIDYEQSIKPENHYPLFENDVKLIDNYKSDDSSNYNENIHEIFFPY